MLAFEALVLGAWVPRPALAGPIHFSNPKSDEVTTNLHQLTNKKDSLKDLEDDLNKSFRSFSGASSLDGVAPPPVQPAPAPVVPSKRLKELMERRKNLFLLTPDDLAHAPTLQEMLKVPEYGSDGMEKQPKSVLELYYERLDAKRGRGLKPIEFEGGDKAASREAGVEDSSPASADGLPLPSGLDEKEKALKKLFATGSADSPLSPVSSRRNSFSDIFGVEQPPLSHEKELEHKKWMEEYNSILEIGTAKPAAADAPAFPTSASSSDVSRQAANPFGTPDGGAGASGLLGSVNPVFSPTGPKDVNAQALGQPSPSLLLPKTDVTKPVAPTFAAPQRPPL